MQCLNEDGCSKRLMALLERLSCFGEKEISHSKFCCCRFIEKHIPGGKKALSQSVKKNVSAVLMFLLVVKKKKYFLVNLKNK